MKRQLVLFGCGIIIFFFFVLFSYLVDKDKIDQFDFDITVRLQDNLPRKVDDFFSFFSDFGSFEIATVTLLVILALRRKLMGFAAFLLYAGFHVIELYGKSFVDHPPPPEFLLRTKKIVEFPQFHVRADYSYPSGHSGRAAFITVLLGFFILKSKKLSRTQKIILMSILGLYDLIMWTSRIYLGEHWVSDVIGGILLGIACAIFAESLIELNWRKPFQSHE